MASVKGTLKKLASKAAISDEELRELQVHVDLLERLTTRRAGATHHDTTTHHHTSRMAEALEEEEVE